MKVNEKEAGERTRGLLLLLLLLLLLVLPP